MAVYVDDAMIPAKVGRWNTTWCHMIADSREELHAFAARLGLRPSYFQESKGIGGNPPKPGSMAAEGWHYDVTANKRERAIELGAVPIDYRELWDVIRRRQQRAQVADSLDPGLWEEGQLIIEGKPIE